MTITKKEFSASDAAPVILYAKQDGDSQIAHPITAGMLNPGLSLPAYDEIELGYTNGDLTGVVYKLNGSTVSTLTLSYTNGNLVGVIKS
jgi:hypothetical protein